MDPISLDTSVSEPSLTPINLDTGINTIPVDPTVAAAKAAKVSIGLPNFQPAADNYKEIVAGREEDLRKQAASRIDFEKSIQKQNMINQWASQNNRPFTPIEAQTLGQFIDAKQTNPETVFEQYFAKTYMDNVNKAATDNPDSYLNEILTRDPSFFNKEKEKAVDLKAKKEAFRNLHQDVLSAAEAQSGPKAVFDTAKLFSIIYGEYNIRMQTGGKDLDAFVSDIYRLPYDEGVTKAKSVVNSLMNGTLGGNPYLALQFTTALTDPTREEEVLRKAFPAIALATSAAGVAKLAERFRGANAANEAFKKAVRTEGSDVPRFVTKFDDIKPQENLIKPFSASVEDSMNKIKISMEEATGNVQEAGVKKASAEISRTLKTDVPKSNDTIEALQSTFDTNINAFGKDLRGLGQETTNRIIESMQTTKTNLVGTLQNMLRIEGTPAVMAVEKLSRKVLAATRDDYPGLANNFMDSKLRRDNLQNILFVDHTLGKTGTELFGTERTARAFLTKNNLEKIGKVWPNGAGFEIRVSKPVDVTKSIIRDGLLELEGTKTPISWTNAWVGLFRTPEETLSKLQNSNRKIAAYGTAPLLKLAYDTAKEIRDLKGFYLPGSTRKQKWKEWERIMDVESRHPETGAMGKLNFRTPGELSDMYQNTLHRLPDDQEVTAAFAFKNQQQIFNQLDILRERTAKLREGSETHTVWVPFRETARSIIPKGYKFDGTRLRTLPNDGDTVLLVGEKPQQHRVTNTTALLRTKGWEDIKEKLDTGKVNLIRIASPEEHPFYNLIASKVGDAPRPRYVISEGKVDASPLEWKTNSVLKPTYDYDHQVVQPIMRYDPVSKRWNYEGDRKIAVHGIRAVAQDLADKLNEMRKAIKIDNISLAKAVHSKSGLPMDFNDIHSWFKSEVSTEGLAIPSRLNHEEDIRVVPYNRTVNEMDKRLEEKYGSSFHDGTKESFNRFRYKEQDVDHLWTVSNRGTADNPLYNIAPLKSLDPIQSMNRALSRVINDIHLNDYKMFSVEHWMQEAKQWLKPTDKQLESSSLYFFHNPQWKEGTPVEIKNNLMTANMQIKQFLGIQDATDTFLHAAAQKLSDSIYKKYGEEYALIPSWSLPAVRDPFRFVRSMAFHAKLGLFNPAQLWVQSNGFANIFGIAGFKHAAPGTRASLFHRWANYNPSPENLAYLDTLMTKQWIPGTAKYKPGEFTEAFHLLQSSGFERVGGEYAARDNAFVHDFVGNGPGRFLNAGTWFFKEGERQARLGAWYTAHREFREAHPTGPVSKADSDGILARADLLNNNMSRASNATINKGIFSVSTQFLTYQLRTMELVTGKRLTPTEKMRLFGTYSVLYGVPGAYGLSGLPVGDYIKKWATENGYVTGDSYIQSAMAEGIPALIGALVTGNWYDVQGRYGSQGFTQVRDAFQSDKTVWDIFGGAATNVLVNSTAGMNGFMRAMLSAIRDDNKAYKLTPDDFVAPFEEISTVAASKRLYAALNYGKWVSKKEAYLTDVSKLNAIGMFISGLNPQQISDMYTKNWTKEEEKNIQSQALSEFTKEFRRFLTTHETDPDLANTYFKNAFSILRLKGYPEEKIAQAVAIASQDYESLIHRTNWDYYTKDVPETRKDAARDAFRRSIQNQNIR